MHFFAGKKARTPGQYFAIDPDSNWPTSRLLENTNEYVHASVRVRYGLQNLGPEDRGPYRPDALKNWKLMGDDGVGDGSTTDRPKGRPFWEYTGKDTRFDDGHGKIFEDELGDIEHELLRHDSTAFGQAPPSRYAERLLGLRGLRNGPFH
ncbi:MAG: hypothetical protein M1815_003951 [Lichina confinis]|nr:MAG: hypothetical protein M1815_003951 [Lichina confinis]